MVGEREREGGREELGKGGGRRRKEGEGGGKKGEQDGRGRAIENGNVQCL